MSKKFIKYGILLLVLSLGYGCSTTNNKTQDESVNGILSKEKKDSKNRVREKSFTLRDHFRNP